jgi:hypothetical protein
MFKRSFNIKDGRVTKTRPVKTTYREHAKKKMQESLDSPPVGRLVFEDHVTLQPLTMFAALSQVP